MVQNGVASHVHAAQLRGGLGSRISPFSHVAGDERELLEKQDYDGFLDLSIQRTLADERDYPRARRKEGTARKAPLTRSQSSNAASLRLNAPVLGFERPVDRLDLLPQYSRTGVWRHDP
jgi:hypothetical protein